MRMQRFFVFSVVFCALFVAACAPSSFVKTAESGWHAVEVRVDISTDVAWKEVVDLLAKKFDLEILSKENGYLRTAWISTWTGEVDENYRVRVLLKFNYDLRIIDVKTEAQRFGGGVLGLGRSWQMGTDERLEKTLLKEIRTRIGNI